MIIRALFVGTILAGLTGAAVFYGLGESLNGETTFPHKTATAKAGNTAEVSALPDREPMKPKNVISVTPVDTADLNDVKTSDKGTKKTLKSLLNKSKDDISKDHMPAQMDKAKDTKAYGSDINEPAEMVPEPMADTASKKVKDLMKPRATGSFIVSDKARDETKSKMTPKDMMAEKDRPSNMMMTSELDKSFKEARRITNKTTRDKIYLEIFDNAIAGDNMDVARRISGKLSTPELRALAREAIADAAK